MMKFKGNTFAVLLAALVLAEGGLAAPPVRKHAPDFNLKISTDAKVVKAQKDMDIPVSVEEKNISSYPVDAGRSNEPGEWYKMVVLCDGKPAPTTPKYQQILSPRKEDANHPLQDSVAFWTIQPGHAQTFHVELSLYFDFSSPGKYEVTFSRGTDPGQPDDVDVRSNTISITVVPLDAQ
jgi:hypothetical protein